ncbi:MAG: hypothetical protein MUE83_02195 [Tabrizicola sp.]|jgi:hypothetical protein|nr:hypothetical protein [Tabrizicola sp.]
MTFRPAHELHRRRFSRNLGLGLTLVAFVVLVFALTVVKVKRGDPLQGFDHTFQPASVPQEASE